MAEEPFYNLPLPFAYLIALMFLGKLQQSHLVYAARIRLNKRSIRVRGRDQIIGPGLAAQAEIKTGERRIIDFLLSPIAQTMDEAGRER